mmetsp:Transcript_77422/g.214061  ORF Transcript_77422/g.214061 Transcript_77422/m.214061 type:complete len:205 (+) Transcript_77422:208-822(+)
MPMHPWWFTSTAQQRLLLITGSLPSQRSTETFRCTSSWSTTAAMAGQPASPRSRPSCATRSRSRKNCRSSLCSTALLGPTPVDSSSQDVHWVHRWPCTWPRCFPRSSVGCCWTLRWPLPPPVTAWAAPRSGPQRCSAGGGSSRGPAWRSCSPWTLSSGASACWRRSAPTTASCCSCTASRTRRCRTRPARACTRPRPRAARRSS